MAGAKRRSSVQATRISSRDCQKPTARPARQAAPRAVVSRTTGRTAAAPRMSAWNCMRKSLALAPPSTRSALSRRPVSCSMARTTSATW